MRAMADRYEALYRQFRWNVPARYNIAQACCGQWAGDRSRFALYWEDESGATAAYTFWDIQREANRLSNALAGLGVRRGERVAILLPQRPETAIAYIAIRNGYSIYNCRPGEQIQDTVVVRIQIIPNQPAKAIQQ